MSSARYRGAHAHPQRARVASAAAATRAALVERRQKDAPELLRDLEALAERSSGVARALEHAAQRFGAGPDGRARLHSLLDAQVYALVFWRRAAHEINYRRFFDINELVALRMEDPAVFGATHAASSSG